MKTKTHAGVYGVIRNGDSILLVRKSRGPYTGKLDLVGGRAEGDEIPEQTLAREVQEETGIEVQKATLWYEHTHVVRYQEHGEEIELNHHAMVYTVEAYDASLFSDTIHAEDVQGAGWYNITDLKTDELSPLVAYALQKIR